MVVAARHNTGKTPLQTQQAICMAAGIPFLGLPTTRCHVCIIDLESQPQDIHELIDRQCTALGVSLEEISPQLDLFVRGNPNDANSRELERVCSRLKPNDRAEWLQDLVEKGEYGALLIDPILDLFPYSSTDEEKIRRMLGDLSEIRYRRPYPLIQLTVHLRKGDRKYKPPSLITDPHGWLEEILGTVVWATNSDVRLGLESRTDGTQVVLCGYRRGVSCVDSMLDSNLWNRY